MLESRGIVVVAQNSWTETPRFQKAYEGIRVDVWYDELEHLSGQHVWKNDTVYRLINDQPADTEFNIDNAELIVENVFVYDDENKSLPFHKEVIEGELVLNNNELNIVEWSGKIDYVEQTCVLAMSLKATNPSEKISIVTNDPVPDQYHSLFDQIIPIPFNDDADKEYWKIQNRWKVIHATPYDHTIVMDSDMIILQDITNWWSTFSNYELFFTNNVYTYRGELVTGNYYRKTFTENNLPNIYTGLYYFKKTKFTLNFFNWLETVVKNWEIFYNKILDRYIPEFVSMDVCTAIVVKILDCEDQVTNKKNKFPSFTHMKPKIQNWTDSGYRWQNNVGVYIDRNCNIKLGNHTQTGILHYTENDFVTPTLINRYRNYLNV